MIFKNVTMLIKKKPLVCGKKKKKNKKRCFRAVNHKKIYYKKVDLNKLILNYFKNL